MIPIESNVFALYSIFLVSSRRHRACRETPQCGHTKKPSNTARSPYNIVIYVEAFHTPGSHGSTASILSHHLPTTIYADSTRTPSLTGHIPLSPSHTLATRKRESAVHAPHISRKHTTIETRRNRHPTTGISVPHIFLIDCAVSLGSLLFSRALSRTGILNLAEEARHFVCSHDSKAPPGQTRRLTRLEEWRCAVTLRLIE